MKREPGEQEREQWATKLGVILAVSAGAVGLGNFLRFPGRAALYGGGAFMIPYFVSLLILGIPLAWIEWTIGRHGRAYGVHSSPGLYSAVWNRQLSRVFGAIGVFIPVVVYMYYVFIEAWCLGYTWYYLTGAIAPETANGSTADYFTRFFAEFVGANENGGLFAGLSPALVCLVICFVVNFAIIYRGVAKGIEAFALWAMPSLLIASVVILVRVLTLGTPDPSEPERNVVNALGFMWNPKPVGDGGGILSTLGNPQVWLEAAGQIFFSIGVGFGIVVNYASYLRRTDDVVLSSLTAVSTNTFCEVCLAGLITIPAAFLFLGAAPLAQVAGSSVGLGFNAVPVIFEYLPAGPFFGFLWFGLLFVAAVTSSVGMLQPAHAFLQEGLHLSRTRAIATLASLTGLGALLVAFLSRDTVALEVMDFWVGSFGLVILGLFEVLLFGWILGAERGVEEANRGADLRIARSFAFVIRYLSPAFLLFVLTGFAYQNFADQVRELLREPAALLTVAFLVLVFLFLAVLVRMASREWQREGRFEAERGSL